MKFRFGWGNLCTAITCLQFFAIPLIVCAQPIPQAIEDVLDRATVIDYNWGYVIESQDLTTEYYGRNANLPMVPASNTKIYTTSAAFGLLGQDHAFRTRVFYTGTRNGGAITGNLILLGEHDITWQSDVFGSGNADNALEVIAQKVKDAGITSVSGSVIGQGAMIYNKSSTGTDHAALSATATMNSAAALQFRAELIAIGVTVSGGSSGSTGFSSPGNNFLLATYRSDESLDSETGQPLDLAEACIALNKGSHNAMADYLMRHIGYIQTGVDTYDAGAAQTISWLQTAVGINTTGIILRDGSGLDNTNKVSARQTVQLIRHMNDNYPRWVETLPIAGVDGTLAGRMTGTLRGKVFAKTGTLPSSGSVALSGIIQHPIDNQRYFFSIFTNTDAILAGGTGAIDTTLTRSAMDDSLTAAAAINPPATVDLLSTRLLSNGNIRLEWTDPGVTTSAYEVFQAEPGQSFIKVATVSTAYIIESGNDNTTLGLNKSDYTDTGNFGNSASHSLAPGLTAGIGSRFVTRATSTGTASFTPSNLPEGRYKVDVTCYNINSADAHNVTVTIVEKGTSGNVSKTARFELSAQTAGDIWRNVGTINFVPGQNHVVTFSNSTQTSLGASDRMNPAAVRFVPLFAEIPAPPTGTLANHYVQAIGPRGLGGKPSDIYSLRKEAWGVSKALIIDGFDRWQQLTSTDNPTRASHDFVAIHAASIPSYSIDSVANEWVENQTINLLDYDAVFWVLGEESTIDETFSDAEQQRVTAYLNAGKPLFLSGSEIGWDLDRTTGPTANDRAFLNNVLRADFPNNANDDANTYQVASSTGNLFEGINNFTFDNGLETTYNADFPDVLVPQNGSLTAFTYIGGTGGTAALSYAGDGLTQGKLIFLGFPFETIIAKSTRDEIMARTASFFGVQTAQQVDQWMIF